MLSDCISKDNRIAELFLVSRKNGDAARHARDRMTQAVLPIGNTLVDARVQPLDSVLDDYYPKCIIAALGAGLELGGDYPSLFMLDRLRYHKIVLAFGHTEEERSLRDRVLALFEQYLYPTFDNGYLYISLSLPQKTFKAEEFKHGIMDPSSRKLLQLDRKTWRDQVSNVQGGASMRG